MSSPLSRSFLFVPASRPERFDKAATSGAHQVILDLEDAVAPADKNAARGSIAQWSGRTDAVVRVNGADSPFFAADMDMIRRAGVTRLMLPKAEPGALNRVVGLLDRPCQIIALIETVRGYAELRSIGKSGLVSQLAFGNLDFGIDAGVTETAQELDPVRLQIVLESRLAGLAPPIDGVTTSWTDAAAFGAAVGRAKALGFGAKLCIHPAQVKPVNDAFLPTADELDWARRVMEVAKAGAAVALDGKMIDAPVIRRAELILAGEVHIAT
ncbi:HpcH/HpaI aldolase/citrate lyase family protein [Bradyrhizobium arachidis]|uniref:CoA ester lyase n=1 Tax=Bradyrhizobium arachidis TaxID=858423 RepID=A0AAE7NUY2_9BRAD|nr:CoA ester lyase [Bradyrhizobium arachidis]QOZ71796.1 CoA ester lyase [Bradyrhizobium arachidis]SFV17978.1 citrate lyase subunit beta / citryl-CoA lyase [Bradyrhizobium arachidis]